MIVSIVAICFTCIPMSGRATYCAPYANVHGNYNLYVEYDYGSYWGHNDYIGYKRYNGCSVLPYYDNIRYYDFSGMPDQAPHAPGVEQKLYGQSNPSFWSSGKNYDYNFHV